MAACPSCNAEQSESSIFCSQCGAALGSEIAATVAHEAGRSTSDSSVHSSPSDSHHGRFLPGTKIAGRYRIVSLVGKGGMGEVYRADDLKLGHTVALKFLPKNLAEAPQRLEYFLSEVRLTRQISHPNICRVYDIGEVDGQHFLSMEYIDGEDLRVLLRRIGKLPAGKSVEIAQQLCAGLAAAHDKSVLHRDLKPANIMLDGRGKVRITDFGLAKVAGENTEGEIAGTPAYMAPEQLIGGQVTIQSDLFALGLILYELFTGEPARQTGSLAKIVQDSKASSLSHRLEFPADLDSDVQRAIVRCLEAEPRDRPSSAAAVAASLPGGDPLAAALAAGETPSPELVAASGGSGVLSIGQAAIYLAVVLLGLAVLVAMHGALSPSVAVTEPAEVFADTSREILDGLQLERAHYEKYQFGLAVELAEAEVNNRKKVDFWYRQSPVPIMPEQTLEEFFGPNGVNGLKNPLPTTEGMISIVLNSAEKLRQLYVVPSLKRAKPERLTEINAQEIQLVFDKAGLTLTSDGQNKAGLTRTSDGQLKFKEKQATGAAARVAGQRPPFDVDDWFVFESGDVQYGQAGTGLPTIERVELAFADGRIVHFNVVETSIKRVLATPWRPAAKPPRTWSDLKTAWNAYRVETAKPDVDENRAKNDYDEAREILVQIVTSWSKKLSNGVSFLTLPLTMILACWNLQLGRCDRRVAWRVAVFIFFVVLLRTQLEYGLTLTMFRSSLQLSAGVAFKFAVYYLALEPILRKFWPGCLTAWSRAMTGRWQDPSLGHALLVGAAMSMVVPLIHAVLIGPSTEFNPLALSGNTALLTFILRFIQFVANWGAYVLIVLVIIRFAVKRDWVAMLITPLLLTLFWHINYALEPSLFLIVLAAYYGTLMLLLLRLGVVAVFSFLFCHHLLLRMPIADGVGPDLTPTVVAVLTILLIAGYGFYISVGGREQLIAKLST